MNSPYFLLILITLFVCCSKRSNQANDQKSDIQSLSNYGLKDLGDDSKVTYNEQSSPVLGYKSHERLLNFNTQPFLVLDIGNGNTISVSVDGERLAENSLAVARLSGKNFTAFETHLKPINQYIDVLELKLIEDQTNGNSTLDMTIHFDYRHHARGNSILTVDNGEAKISGELGLITYNQVLMLNKNYPTTTTINFVAIPGSLDQVNHETGRLIREAGYTTKIDSKGKVQGGGIDLFCAGKKRIIEKVQFLESTLGVVIIKIILSLYLKLNYPIKITPYVVILWTMNSLRNC